MRVLHLITSIDPRGGGPQEGLRQYCLCAATLGHEFEIASFDPPDAAVLRAFPAPVHALGPPVSRYWYAPRAIGWLAAHAREYDAVVIHGLWAFHVYAGWRALRGSGVPYFVFPHGMLDPWFKRRYPMKHLKKWLFWPWAEYRALRDAAAVLFTAEEEARLAPRSFGLYCANPAVVGFGIAPPPAARAVQVEALFAAYPPLRGRRFVLFLGRVHPKKGCDLAIEALAQVSDLAPDLGLVLAGPAVPGLEDALRDLARRRGVADRITWTGMIEGDVKWGALRAAEALILPSHQENFGVAPVEAMACGTPVLLSDKVNIWREIAGDGAGFVRPDTAEGAAGLLVALLALDAGERSAMGARAVACYRSRFGIEATTRRLLETIAGAGAGRVPACA